MQSKTAEIVKTLPRLLTRNGVVNTEHSEGRRERREIQRRLQTSRDCHCQCHCYVVPLSPCLQSAVCRSAVSARKIPSITSSFISPESLQTLQTLQAHLQTPISIHTFLISSPLFPPNSFPHPPRSTSPPSQSHHPPQLPPYYNLQTHISPTFHPTFPCPRPDY